MKVKQDSMSTRIVLGKNNRIVVWRGFRDRHPSGLVEKNRTQIVWVRRDRALSIRLGLNTRAVFSERMEAMDDSIPPRWYGPLGITVWVIRRPHTSYNEVEWGGGADL